MAPFDEVHFFFDESGSFSGTRERNRLDLLGGILLLGPYDDEANNRLLRLLEQHVTAAGGTFPRHLHFSDTSFPGRKPFLTTLAADLPAWQGAERQILGVSLRSSVEPEDGVAGILSERRRDYRYLSMLWALVEHLLFVDDELASRLTAEPRVHLHIAARAYVFDPAIEAPDEIEALGYRVVPARSAPGKLAVPNIIQERDLLTMLRMALRHRWRNATLRLEQLEVRSLDYAGGTSSALFYLSDLYLGLERHAALASMRRFRPQYSATLVPTFRRLEYGPWLDLLAQMQAALVSADGTGYLRAAEQFAACSGNLTAYQPIVSRQEQAAAALLATDPECLMTYLDEACGLVDEPGRAAEGLRRADQAVRLLRSSPERNARAEVLALQTHLSYANHHGDTDLANVVWERFLERESSLAPLGFEGLRLRAELCNRRAVNLTDRFRYAEAEEVLRSVIADQDQMQATLTALLGPAGPAVLPNRALGACHGTMGQIHCFLGTEERRVAAQASFRHACSFFDNPGDVDRQYVYLGHLACDCGAAGRLLWEEVLRRFPFLTGPTPFAEPNQQFLLALQLKGQGVFAAPGDRKQFIDQWEQRDPLLSYSSEEQRQHPFGLIHQGLALLYARLWRDSRQRRHADQALTAFDRAARHLETGGPILQALARFAEVRRELFRVETSGGERSALDRLGTRYLALRGHLAAHFGAAAWSEDEAGRAHGHFGERDPGVGTPLVERARRVVEAVRFNYW